MENWSRVILVALAIGSKMYAKPVYTRYKKIYCMAFTFVSNQPAYGVKYSHLVSEQAHLSACSLIFSGMVFTYWHRMKDTLIILFVFVSGYVASISMVIVLAKLFFPLFTKEELKKRQNSVSLHR